MSDTPTPRTDAAEERIVNHHGIDAYIVTSHFARQLERELAAERESQFKWKSAALSTALYRADCEVSTPDDYQRHQAEASCALIQRAEQAEARLADILQSGTPWPLQEILEKLLCASDILFEEYGFDTHGYELVFAARREGKALSKTLSTTEPPALLKEVEELRKRIHELQGVPFSDRNYGAMRDKLETIRTAAKVALEDVYSHKTNDKDGNHICWLGETSFLLVEKALEKIK